MTRARLLAGLLLAAGIGVGTMTDRLPVRAETRAGEFWILSGDFHVHAAPGDGTLLPWELRREAARAGLDVVTITNHNTTIAARFGRWWMQRSDAPFPIILAGEEITAPGYHMAAVGIRHTVDRRQPAASAIEAVHAQGGLAIAAHPGRKYWDGYDDRALALLDGTESANGSDPIIARDYAAFRNRVLTRKASVAAIGSSDFHAWPSLGRCRTYLFVRERSEAGVFEAIRAGRTVAEDEQGNLYGASEWVREVETQRPAGRSDENASWRRLSLASAWTGVAGLLLFGRTRRWS